MVKENVFDILVSVSELEKLELSFQEQFGNDEKNNVQIGITVNRQCLIITCQGVRYEISNSDIAEQVFKQHIERIKE